MALLSYLWFWMVFCSTFRILLDMQGLFFLCYYMFLKLDNRGTWEMCWYNLYCSFTTLSVSESGLIPPSTKASTADDNFPQVQLFPPSNTTELPRFAAPIIVPTMIHGSVDGVIRPVPVIATNPVSGVHVATNDTTDILQIPNFDDDEQMFHYVITRLHRAIRDCQTVVEVRPYFAQCTLSRKPRLHLQPFSLFFLYLSML